MSSMQIDSVLSQIRALSAQIKAPAHPTAPTNSALQTNSASPTSSFSDLMKQGLGQVNATQQRADNLATAFQRGTPGVELADVMLEMQKANVSFRAVTEVA